MACRSLPSGECAGLQRADKALGVVAVGWRAGDQDPVVDRPGTLVDEDGRIYLGPEPFVLLGMPQPVGDLAMPAGEARSRRRAEVGPAGKSRYELASKSGRWAAVRMPCEPEPV